MPTNLLIQYIAVGTILLGVLAWVIYKAVTRDKNISSGSCHGCSLSQVCGDSKRENGGSRVANVSEESQRAKCNDHH